MENYVLKIGYVRYTVLTNLWKYFLRRITILRQNLFYQFIPFGDTVLPAYRKKNIYN